MRNKTHLFEIVWYFWYSAEQKQINKFIESMPKTWEAVIKAKKYHKILIWYDKNSYLFVKK